MNLSYQKPHTYLFRVLSAWLFASACYGQVETPVVVRWEFEATVVRKSDPLGLFPDVRLGDPAHGMLKYDLTLWPNFFFSEEDSYGFTNESWQDTARFTIENPRTGVDFTFENLTSDGDGLSIVIVDYAHDQSASTVPDHRITALQSVMAPEGFQGTNPSVAVSLIGPAGTLDAQPERFLDARLPNDLTLEDWPTTLVSFYDSDFNDPSETFIDAVIYSMTAKITEAHPGDYDYDGDVDARDYEIWHIEIGDTRLLYADGTRDGIVDASDYSLWREAYLASGGQVLPGDVDHNGVVNENDLPRWEAEFGIVRDGNDYLEWQVNADAVPSVEASQATIPEPAVFTLVILSTMTAAMLRY